MFKNPINAERGDSPQRLAAQRLAPPTNLFEAKTPENAFSASKGGAFSGHFAAAPDGKRRAIPTRVARKEPCF